MDAEEDVVPVCPDVLTSLSPLSVCHHSRIKYHASQQLITSTLGSCLVLKESESHSEWVPWS